MRAAADPEGTRPRYREYAPAPDLAGRVHCFWRIRADKAPLTPNRICPDGCADLVVSDGVVHAVGSMRTAVILPLTGRVDLFGVRFRPGEALPFFDVPLAELTDAAVGVEQLGWAAGRDLGEQLAGAVTTPHRIALIEAALRTRQARTGRRTPPPALRAAVRLLEAGNGGPGLRRVREAVGTGERTLERQFQEMVGLSPKGFERVARFRRVLARMQGRPRVPYAAMAIEAGYADQAHFIREFKSLSGLTPAAYAREWDAVGFVQYGPPTSA